MKILFSMLALIAVLAAGCTKDVPPSAPTSAPTSPLAPSPNPSSPVAPAPTTPSAPSSLGGNSQALRVEVRDVRVAVPPLGVPEAVLVMAQKFGTFEERGLRVTYVNVPNTKAALQAVQRGDVELAVVTLQDAGDAAKSQTPVKAITAVLGSNPYNLVVTAQAADTLKLSNTMLVQDRMAMMKGLRVGVTDEVVATTSLNALIQAANITPQEITVVKLQAGQELAAMRDGKVNGLFVMDPVLEQAIVDLKARMLINLSRGEVAALEPFPWLVLVTTNTFAARAPNTLVGMVYGVVAAQRQIRADTKRATDILADQYASLPKDIYLEAVRIYFPAMPSSLLTLTPASFGRVMKTIGNSEATYGQVVDNRFVEALIPKQ
ncbi:MAG: hypothetical protein EXR67_05755 [Dehalococcoidia bacterium]|nr:hypothetical protein [Dehalococcoidia bacterium]